MEASQFPTTAPATPTVAELEAKVASLETELAGQHAAADVAPVAAPPKPSIADRLKELVFGENKTLDDALAVLGHEGYANDPLVAVVETLVKAVFA